ncbi:hypothetical protein AK812_SmicGene9969 [Symbiodinium microadriaticum]|uniref:Uncharacterized protein n=1 Tax=Symbiodinium microadriaticum TaxID=2951 RepID=A0A1Q9EH39_SYMMI|nr:hypothetical protein AK812_SmicGene9969 [Symbiodinium microadriaticum]
MRSSSTLTSRLEEERRLLRELLSCLACVHAERATRLQAAGSPTLLVRVTTSWADALPVLQRCQEAARRFARRLITAPGVAADPCRLDLVILASAKAAGRQPALKQWNLMSVKYVPLMCAQS